MKYAETLRETKLLYVQVCANESNHLKIKLKFVE